MERETILTLLGGGGDISSLKEHVDEAINRGATSFRCHLQASQSSYYVQMIEFARVLTDEEVLLMEREKIQARLNEIDSKLKGGV